MSLLPYIGSRGLLLAILADRELSLTLFVISFDWLEKCYATFATVPPLPPAISPLRWHLYITAALAGLLWWTPARMRVCASSAAQIKKIPLRLKVGFQF